MLFVNTGVTFVDEEMLALNLLFPIVDAYEISSLPTFTDIEPLLAKNPPNTVPPEYAGNVVFSFDKFTAICDSAITGVIVIVSV